MTSASALPRIHLMRHGETEWSLAGRHTSRTEIALTARGESQAAALQSRLSGITFSHVLVSPRRRARQTCELAGLAANAETVAELREWDYGDYEGLTRVEITARRPGWNLFTDGAQGGESASEVYTRAQGVVHRLRGLTGEVAIFSHGHFLRVLAVAWIGLPVIAGKRFGLGTASVGRLSFEHDSADEPIIALWNEPPAPAPA